MSEQQAVRMATDAELKELITEIADVVDLANGITLGNIIAIGINLPPVIRDIGVMWPEYKGLDDAARSDLEAFIPTVLVIPNNVAIQSVATVILDLVIQLSKLFSLGLVKAK